jgi:HEAT repeat protein
MKRRTGWGLLSCAVIGSLALLVLVRHEFSRHLGESVVHAGAQDAKDTKDADTAAAVKALADTLTKDDDPSVRKIAAQTLGSYGSRAESAVPALIGALSDAEVDVRGAAALALGRIGKSAKTAAMPLADLVVKDGDRDVRCAAALALTRIGRDAKAAVKTATPRLLEACKGDDKQVCVYARCALVILEDDPAPHVKSLAESLSDANADVRGSAAYVLGELSKRARTAVPALAAALKDSDLAVRRAVVRALGEMGDDARSAVPALAGTLKDADAEIRSLTAMSLAEIGPEARVAVPQLIEALKDKEVQVRGSAVFALGEIGASPQTAVPAITQLLRDENADVRRAAALALGKFQNVEKD